MTRQARTERTDSRESSSRKRVPLGGHRQKLQVNAREGYKRRWINDKEGRLLNAENGGYLFVEDPTLQVGDADLKNEETGVGSRVRRLVGSHKDGSPMYAYLMEIKEEWYEQDQADKQKAIDEVEDAIKRGNVDGGIEASERYTPKGGGVRIEN